jgi:hypothetical protein
MKLCYVQENGWAGDHHGKRNKSVSERQISHLLSYVEPRRIYAHICKINVGLFEGISRRGKGKENDRDRMTLKYITSMHEDRIMEPLETL